MEALGALVIGLLKSTEGAIFGNILTINLFICRPS